jgi:allantoinase
MPRTSRRRREAAVAEGTRNIIDDGALNEARPGLDHDWFEFSPLPERPPVSWPGGARVAVAVVLDLRAAEWERPDHPPAVPPVGGRGVHPYPDIPRMSHREFGHRVGIFRLLEVLANAGIAPALALDVLTAEAYPQLLPHVLPHCAEVVAGGLSASRPITSAMSLEEERDYVGLTLERLAAVLAGPPAGWLGPEHSESSRTPGVLADAGLRYVADWPNDERPYPMPGAGGLWSFPLSWELSDLSCLQLRGLSAATYATALQDAVDGLARRDDGRVLAVHLHPWLSGQAFRAGAVEEALARIAADERTWVATPVEIVDRVRDAHERESQEER